MKNISYVSDIKLTKLIIMLELAFDLWILMCTNSKLENIKLRHMLVAFGVLIFVLKKQGLITSFFTLYSDPLRIYKQFYNSLPCLTARRSAST
jgi:hypothetical protein